MHIFNKIFSLEHLNYYDIDNKFVFYIHYLFYKNIFYFIIILYIYIYICKNKKQKT